MPSLYCLFDSKLVSRQASELLGDLRDYLFDGCSTVVFKGLLYSLSDLNCEGVKLG